MTQGSGLVALVDDDADLLHATTQLLELAGFAEKPLCRGQIEAGQRCAADGRHGPELHDSGEPQLLDGADCLHPDDLADAKVLFTRGRLIDHDLVFLRPCAVD